MLSANAVALAAVSSLACAGILMSFLAVLSLRQVVRSLDIFVTSLLLTLLGNAAIVVLMPSLMSPTTARDDLTCRMYVWAVVTLRLSSLASCVALSVERILLIRRPGKYRYRATVNVCVGILMMWVVAMCLASILATVQSRFTYTIGDNATCTLFFHEMHREFGVFVIIIELAAMVACTVCMSDIYCHLRYLTKNTLFSSKSFGALSVGRNFYADARLSGMRRPTLETIDMFSDVTEVSTMGRTHASVDVSTLGRSHVTEGSTLGRDNPSFMQSTSSIPTDLRTSGSTLPRDDSKSTLPLDTVQGSVKFASAYESCRLVMIILAVMFALDHVPYVIVTTYGCVHPSADASTMHVVITWLMTSETLLVPVCMWVCNSRYRQALIRAFTCCCRGEYFLPDDEPIIMNGHDVKYYTSPDYASHHLRYQDISKAVHKDINRRGPLNLALPSTSSSENVRGETGSGDAGRSPAGSSSSVQGHPRLPSPRTENSSSLDREHPRLQDSSSFGQGHGGMSDDSSLGHEERQESPLPDSNECRVQDSPLPELEQRRVQDDSLSDQHQLQDVVSVDSEVHNYMSLGEFIRRDSIGTKLANAVGSSAVTVENENSNRESSKELNVDIITGSDKESDLPDDSLAGSCSSEEEEENDSIGYTMDDIEDAMANDTNTIEENQNSDAVRTGEVTSASSDVVKTTTDDDKSGITPVCEEEQNTNNCNHCTQSNLQSDVEDLPLPPPPVEDEFDQLFAYNNGSSVWMQLGSLESGRTGPNQRADWAAANPPPSEPVLVRPYETPGLYQLQQMFIQDIHQKGNESTTSSVKKPPKLATVSEDIEEEEEEEHFNTSSGVAS